jgi:hypothetical protein
MMGGRREYINELGLDQLIRVLNQPDYRTLVLVAGTAFRELPPAMLQSFHSAYEWFLREFSPHYGDHPLALPPRLSTPHVDHGFWDRTRESQVAFALPYSLLLLLQAVLIDDSERDSTTRFKRFVQLLLTEVDVLSAKEIEIARWCLSPPIDRDRLYTERRKTMIENFARFKRRRRPKSKEDLRRISLNGAHDLWMITTAVYFEAHGLAGIAQDVWIATYDAKFAAYCELVNYIPAGAMTGAIAAYTNVPTAADPGYWHDTGEWLHCLSRQRTMEGRGRIYSEEERIELVRRAEAILDRVADSRFP